MKKIFTLTLAVLIINCLVAQEIGTTYTPVVSQSTYFDVSPPIRDIAIPPQGANAHHQWKGKVVENKFMDKKFENAKGALPIGEDPSWQKDFGEKGITVPIQNFEGTRNSDNVSILSPPDTDGDVGPNHYFQMCNVIFQIFSKSGASLLGPLDNSTIWAGFVGPWTGTNDGDPIILYDEQADRWLVSQFAVNTSNGTYWELVAISQTGDPTGSYYRYAFQFASFPDYPKFGIWRDGYYIMVQHGTAVGNVTAASFNRTQMLAGNPTAQMVSFPMPNLPGGGFIGMLPSDNDGDWAPVGAPNYFMYFSDDAWGDDPVDRLKVWEFHVNWTTPALSTLTLTTNLNTAAFDSYFGSFSSGWITQPVTTQKLATLEGALMNRLQYRNFGGYQSMVCCHTVDVNGANRAGVRWYELRKTTGAWYIYQQGTYSPGTTDNYWMASIAQNADGDIALGFSVSSTATYPSIRYTGREYGDALGSMTLTEQSIYAGAAYQSGTHRWGDYSMMSVDPIDDKTFWYTNEYINSSATWSDWVTRIASFSFNDYCAAGGGCYEHISNVQIGSINNSSGCNGYADYTYLSTNIHNSSTALLTVTNGMTSYPSDQCGVWVDWNSDGDFIDASETVTVSGTPGVGPYTATIDPPVGVTLGTKTMRIRITYTGTVSSCGTTTYGEVEDYTVNVYGTPGLWAGTVSTNWDTGANWDDGNVPTSSVDVTIPSGTPYQPTIGVGLSAYARNVTILSGAVLTQAGSTGNWFYVFGDFNSDAGQFIMTGTSYLYFDGANSNSWDDDNENDTYTWVRVEKTSSTAQTTMWQNMTCSGNLEVREGIFAIDGTWTLTVTGTGSTAFEVESGGKLVLTDETIDVAGSITFFDGSQATVSGGTIRCGGNLNVNANVSYNIVFAGGTLVMDGSSTQYINDLDGGAFDINNLTISKTGGVCYLQSANLDVNGAVLISGGTLSANNAPTPTASYNIKVGSNWTNTVGAGGFVPGTGTVVFHSLTGTAQDAEGINTFYNVLQDNTGQYLRFNLTSGNTTIQNNLELHYYSWAYRLFNVNGILNIDDVSSRFTSNGPNGVATIASLNQGGRLISNGGGSLTVNDLVENGLFGSYYVNSASDFMQITNSGTGTYVDLAADLHILGGTMKINGTISWWPYGGNAAIEMTGGVLDLTGCGIYINNNVSLSLNDNITGGTIRTIVGFSGNRADFAPTAGVFEFYGPNDAVISQSNGCTLYNVNINKGAKDGFISKPELAGSVERKDETWGGGGKANSISLGSNFTITNNLTITAGSFVLNGFQANVNNDCDVYGSLVMTNAADVLDVGTDSYDNLTFYPGSAGNLSAGSIYLKSWIVPMSGCSFTASTGNTIYFTGSNTSGGLGNNEPTAVYGNVHLIKTTNRTYLDAVATYPIVVNGTFNVDMGNILEMQDESLIVHGTMINNATSQIYAYNAKKEGTVGSTGSMINLSSDNQTQQLEDSGSKGGNLEIDTDFTLNGLMDVGDGNVLLHSIFHLASTGNLNITSGSFIADGPLFAKSWEYIDGHLGLTSGLFEISHNSIQFSATGTSTVSGGIIRSGEAFASIYAGNFQPTGGTLEIVGVGSNTIYCDNGNYFYNLLINRDPAASSYLYDNITINNNLTVNAGTLHFNQMTVSVYGGVTLNGGILFVNSNANLLLAESTILNVNSGGKLYVIGESGIPGKVSRISTGYYAFKVQSGGTIAAQYGIFEYMDLYGIYLYSGSLVDPVNSFNNCTFQYQNPVASSSLFTIAGPQVFTASNASFPVNTGIGTYNVWKSDNAGDITFFNASGAFAGAEFEYDPYSHVQWTMTPYNVSLTVFLEGPFNTSTNLMNTSINTLLPLGQPYGTPPPGNPTPDWLYTGTESVGSIPSASIVDWVEVQLRDATTAAGALPARVIARKVGFLLNTGVVVGLDGLNPLSFNSYFGHNLYAVVWHRNHLGVLSANSLTPVGGGYSYNFSSGAGQAYTTGVPAQKLLATGIYGMKSGDGTGNGLVETTDKTIVWSTQAGKTGYREGDYNMNRQVNNPDKDDKWLPNLGSGSFIPE